MGFLARLSFSLTVSLIAVVISQESGVAQTQPRQGTTASRATGNVTGRVTVGGEPAAGVNLVLRKYRSAAPGDEGIVGRAITDHAGKYRFENVPEGHFAVAPVATAFVQEQENSFNNEWPAATVRGGETVENVNLALIRGGVITGKAVDADGFPLTGMYVEVERVGPQGQSMAIFHLDYNSRLIDDRGVYRIYGLPAGSYRVSVGNQGMSRVVPSSGHTPTPQTWHPSTNDISEARLVEVETGRETTGVDIRLLPPEKTYTVAGRVVDAVTGAGIANVALGWGKGRYRSLRQSDRTEAEGRFRLDGFPSGEFEIYGQSDSLTEFYCEPVKVEIRDRDVEGVEVRMRRGINISGRIVFEGVTDPQILARISDIQIQSSVKAPQPTPPRFGSRTKVEPDGSFRIDGLWPGQVTMTLGYFSLAQGFYLKRVEHNGEVKDAGLEIVAGRDVDGVRLIVGYGSGSIRGQVKLADGELPAGRYFVVSARFLGKSTDYRGNNTARADVQGRFILEGLPPGEYEVVADINPVNSPDPSSRIILKRPPSYPKAIVSHGKMTEVSITLEIVQNLTRP
ncbi:MAG: carboxypeptidase regulatory-like domain-containing protein [Acidobacteria bacterium]|nr:carboxypeptidase regulatory-like domain-containing protein [Acidobacteriota bacterium]MCW5968052.1 carboxypeptidase regulatory-like domain-containing protein [Blastocatellales bacterium]